MSETDEEATSVETDTGSGATDADREDHADTRTDDAGPLADASVWRYLRLGAIGLLALLAVVATVQLYSNVSSAIGQWVADEWVSTFLAAFNLVVLLLALAGLAVLARRR